LRKIIFYTELNEYNRKKDLYSHIIRHTENGLWQTGRKTEVV